MLTVDDTFVVTYFLIFIILVVKKFPSTPA